MENTKNELINSSIDNHNESSKERTYVQLNYIGQEINSDNPEYKQWEIAQFDKLGKDIVLYKCKNDNIIFYGPIGPFENEKILYECQCPKCKMYICHFCLLPQEVAIFNGSCCVPRRLSYLFLYASKYFFGKNDFTLKNYYSFLIPFYSIICFIIGIQKVLFFHLKMKNDDSPHLDYEDYLMDKSFQIPYWIIVCNIFLFVLFIMLPFLILDIYITIFLLIISIPFKNSPIRSVVGMIQLSLKI